MIVEVDKSRKYYRHTHPTRDPPVPNRIETKRPYFARLPHREATRRATRFIAPSIELMEDRMLLSAGDLDPSFGGGGTMVVSFAQPYVDSGESAIQPDGKIVVLGTSDYGGYDYGKGDFSLIRLSSSGALDPTFGTVVDAATGRRSGTVITDLGTTISKPLSNELARGVALQSDGKILVSGFTRFGTGSLQFALVRYLPSGDLDTTFGGGTGWISTDFTKFGSNGADFARIAIQPDGKIVAAGTEYFPGSRASYGLARYNADGSLDTSFGAGGLVSGSHLQNREFSVSNVALQSNGKIVVSGGPNCTIVRYNADGSEDDTFGIVGVASDGGVGGGYSIQSAVQSDDKIVLTAGGGVGTSFVIERFTKDGARDPTFGTNGIADPSFSGSSSAAAYNIAIQNDGKIVAAGYAQLPGGDIRIGITRYDAQGHVDTSFGANGLVFTSVKGAASAGASWVAIQNDRKIVVSGSASFPSHDGAVVTRYLGDLSGAKDLGLLTRPVVIPDSLLGQNNDEYYRFTLPASSNTSLALYNNFIFHPFSGDANLELLDGDGTLIDASRHSGESTDTVSRILQSGVYFIHVFKSGQTREADFSLNLSAVRFVPAPSVTGAVSRDGRVIPDTVTITRIDGQPIVPSSQPGKATTTWLIIHGKDGRSSDRIISGLAAAVDAYSNYHTGFNDQVLTLDWHTSASDNSPTPLSGAEWITSVAHWAAQTLVSLGIDPTKLNLIGHSWGSYVAFEIAKELVNSQHRGYVQSIVALDPATNIPLANLYPASQVDFSKYARWSWAFTGTAPITGDVAGSNRLAVTASESFKMEVPGTSIIDVFGPHSNVVDLFATLVRDSNKSDVGMTSHFSLSNLLNGQRGPWDQNALPGYPGFEGFIMGQTSATSDANPWNPVSLQYESAGRGVRESVMPDALGLTLEQDPAGDTFGTAQGLRITNKSQSIASWLGVTNTSDVYKIVLTASAVLNLRILGPLGSGAAASLYSQASVPIGTIQLNNSLSRRLTVGVYYIRVTVAQGRSPDNPYTLALSQSPVDK